MICLLRHGEIDASPERRFIEQTDLPLNGIGRRQARKWRDALESVRWKGVFCSDLARSREPAVIIAETSGAPVRGRRRRGGLPGVRALRPR